MMTFFNFYVIVIIGENMKRIFRNRILFYCFLLLGFSALIYGINTYIFLSRNIELEMGIKSDSNDIEYMYDTNGNIGLDITLDTLKEGETAAAHNTKELQEAMNKVSEAGGGTIYLPSGTYYFGPGGYNNTTDQEDFAIKCRNNVHLKGKGTDENSSSYTILKPYYNNPSASGGMDMFYFNNYKDSGYKSNDYSTTSLVNVSYIDTNGKTVAWNDQTVYLINADFSDFVIDGDSARGGIASAGGSYRTDGKGFMISLFSDCDWNNVVVKNVDATGFGVDCPINSTIRNCKAINCGKAATQDDGGASGFGIGTGYSDDESMIIENSIAINNKKFGFFFEHQAKFRGDKYKATTSKGFVVSNSIAGGNMYDFGGLKGYDISYENNKSISNLSSYKVDGIKPINTNAGAYGYSALTFTDGKVNINEVVQPIYFSQYSSNSFAVNTNVFDMLTDVNNYKEEVRWAVDSGIIPVNSATKFGAYDPIGRMEIVKILYAFTGREIPITNTGTIDEREQYKNSISSIGYTDLMDTKYIDELDNVIWAYKKDIISKDALFSPEQLCNRAQFITMLYRMEGKPEVNGTSPFSDVESGTWYYNPVIWAYNNGILTGTTGDQFSPLENINKIQLAIFLYRYKNSSTRNYKLKINDIGGDSNNINNNYYNSNSNYTLVNPTKSGYTFLGWTGSNGVNPSKNVVINSGTTGNLSYTANWKPNLINLFIKEEPNVKAYSVGSNIDTTGLVVGAKYGDNNVVDVKDYSISPNVLNKAGNQVITISYGGLKTTYNVTVSDKVISKISVSKNPDNLYYYVGDKINTTGLELKVLYNDGTSSIIKDGYTINSEVLSEVGTNKITVKYREMSTSFEVYVQNIEITSIKIKSYPKKLDYYIGEYLNSDGLILTVTYNNGVVEEINSGYTVDVKKLNVVGENLVTIKYNEKSCDFKVNVKKDKVISIKVNELPKKVNYYIGEQFNSNGLKISVIKDSGYKEVITNDFKLSIQEGYVFKNKGVFTVKVSYDDFTTKFDVNIHNLNDNVLNIVNLPNKTNYVVGEQFNSDGISVELVSSDAEHTEINDYKLSIENGTILTDKGVVNVMVTYGEYSANFDIVIKKVISLEVNRVSNKSEYNIGEVFKLEDIIVTAEYEDGEKEILNDQYKIEVQDGNKFTSPGEKKITLTYGDVTSEFTVNVKDNDIINDIDMTKEDSNINIFGIIVVGISLLLLILTIYIFKKKFLDRRKQIM